MEQSVMRVGLSTRHGRPGLRFRSTRATGRSGPFGQWLGLGIEIRFMADAPWSNAAAPFDVLRPTCIVVAFNNPHRDEVVQTCVSADAERTAICNRCHRRPAGSSPYDHDPPAG